MPLLFKTLSKDCRDDIWSFIDYHVDCYQASEKDSVSARALWAVAVAREMKILKQLHSVQCMCFLFMVQTIFRLLYVVT